MELIKLLEAFEMPEANVIRFENEDVITTSGGITIYPGDGDDYEGSIV